jgi:alpha-glucosidase (family GH31 glycosyl hydrolase)
MGPALQYVGEKALEPLSLNLFPGDKGEFSLYEDDGISLGYEQGKFVTTRYQLRGDEHTAELEVFAREGNYEIPSRSTHVILRDGRQYQQKQFVDNGEARIVRFERMIRTKEE